MVLGARRRTVFWLLGAFALGALGHAGYAAARWRVKPERIAHRYAALLPLLPADAVELGYVSDAPGTSVADWLRYEAQYSLAPRVLHAGAKARYTIADLADPSQLDAVCARENLRPVAPPENGVALLEPRPR